MSGSTEQRIVRRPIYNSVEIAVKGLLMSGNGSAGPSPIRYLFGPWRFFVHPSCGLCAAVGSIRWSARRVMLELRESICRGKFSSEISRASCPGSFGPAC